MMLYTLFIAPLLYAEMQQFQLEAKQESAHIEEKEELSNEDLSKVGYNCIAYVISRGVKLPPGNAIDQKPNSMIPRVGGIVIMKYRSGEGHVAYIESLDGGIHIASSNVIPGKITREVLQINDPRIKGYAYY